MPKRECPRCGADASGGAFFGNRLVKCLNCNGVFCGKCAPNTLTGGKKCPFCGEKRQSQIRFL